MTDFYEKETKDNLISDKIFTIGVTTVLFKVYLFAGYPQYFFIFCLFQAPFFFYLRFRLAWKKSMALYFMEWCWHINILGWCYLCFEALAVFTSFEMSQYLSGESRQ